MTLRFQPGGTVREGAFYVERPADTELLEALLQGEFCYLLEPRQIGKSSLRARTQRRLRERGIRSATIDLSGIGVDDVKEEEWYFGLLEEVTEELNLGDPVAFWERYAGEPPVARWSRFLRDIVLADSTRPTVLFVEEVGSITELLFPWGSFFASIRELYDLRKTYSVYRSLTFCLVGVAATADLIRDTAQAPFSMGRRIRLKDFTHEQAKGFLPGLATLGGDTGAWLEAILAWTGGHPYMIQRVGQALTERPGRHPETVEADVERVVTDLFLRCGRTEDYSLAAAESSFVQQGVQRPCALAMLQLYRQVIDRQRVRVAPDDPVQARLQLTGLVAEQEEASGVLLRVRNRIFATVFSSDWARLREHELLYGLERPSRGGTDPLDVADALPEAAALAAGVYQRAVSRPPFERGV